MKAFLDTNLLMGNLSTSILLANAEGLNRIYQPLWNSHVIRELRRHLPETVAPQDADMVLHRIDIMVEAFPEAEVHDWERFVFDTEPYVSDRDDRQILAGAIAGQADMLVTENVKDFHGDAILSQWGIRVMRESTFLHILLNAYPREMVGNLQSMTAAFRRPPRNLRELVERMTRIESLRGFGADMQRYAEDEYRRRVGRAYGIRNRQGRDRLGRFTTVDTQWDDMDLDLPADIWGPTGNGPFA